MKSISKELFLLLFRPLIYFQDLLYTARSLQMKKLLGGLGKNIRIQYPYKVCGVKNITMHDNVSIGPGSTIYTTGAKLTFHPHITIGPNLTIITGDHMHKVGRFIDSICGSEKTPDLDQDVTIESDVWIGCNVTILKGVTIGHGSIVAAGAVVTKSCPPYSILGGVPAKVIKQVYSPEVIIEHERILYRGTYHIV